jgi:hypothetical protein
LNKGSDLKPLKLNEEDFLFLDTLTSFGYGHVSEAKLKNRLLELGVNETIYNAIKKRLLFGRVIGSVYGNITLERKDYREPDELEIA